jgi:hypothetical protein
MITFRALNLSEVAVDCFQIIDALDGVETAVGLTGFPQIVTGLGETVDNGSAAAFKFTQRMTPVSGWIRRASEIQARHG